MGVVHPCYAVNRHWDKAPEFLLQTTGKYTLPLVLAGHLPFAGL